MIEVSASSYPTPAATTFLGFAGARDEGSAVQAVIGRLEPTMAQAINATGKTFLFRPSICSPCHTGFTRTDSRHSLNSWIVAESHLMIVMCASPLSVLQFLIGPPLG
jgi:hypothetical protein